MAVTIPGQGNTPVTITSGSGDSLNLASMIGNLLASLKSSSDLLFSSVTGGAIPTPPTTAAGQSVLLDLTSDASPLSATIPAGYNFVNASGTAPTTLTGSDVAIVGGSIGSSYTVNGQSTVAAAGGNNLIVGNGSYELSAGSGNNTISGSGNGTIAGGTGFNLLAAVSGNNLILSTGTDTVIGEGTSNTTVKSSGNSSFVFGSTAGGSLTLTISGSAATVSAASSGLTSTLAGTGALVFGGQTNAGALNIADSGANDSISALSSATTVTASASSHSLFVFGGAAALTFVGSSTPATILGGSATNSIVGGTGGMLYGSEGNDTVVGFAPGGATVFGTSGHEVTYLGAGNLLYAAGAGNETLNATYSSGTNDLFAVGSGNASINGGSGSNLFDAGSGSDTFTGGAGSNTYFFLASNTLGSHEFITNLSSTDSVGLVGYNPALSTVSVANGSATLTLSDNTQITFVNVTDLSKAHINYTSG